MKTAATALERVAIGVASLVLSVGLIALMSGFFAGRDAAGVAGTVSAPGQAFRDLGSATLAPGAPRPAYDSSPPTSGAHLARPVLRDGAALSDDQLLTALQAGDVVLMYGGPSAPAGLEALARALAPPFSPALAASGQAVILVRRAGIPGVVGVAWGHMVQVQRADDPALRSFVEFWLGRGAPRRR